MAYCQLQPPATRTSFSAVCARLWPSLSPTSCSGRATLRNALIHHVYSKLCHIFEIHDNAFHLIFLCEFSQNSSCNDNKSHHYCCFQSPLTLWTDVAVVADPRSSLRMGYLWAPNGVSFPKTLPSVWMWGIIMCGQGKSPLANILMVGWFCCNFSQSLFPSAITKGNEPWKQGRPFIGRYWCNKMNPPMI